MKVGLKNITGWYYFISSAVNIEASFPENFFSDKSMHACVVKIFFSFLFTPLKYAERCMKFMIGATRFVYRRKLNQNVNSES